MQNGLKHTIWISGILVLLTSFININKTQRCESIPETSGKKKTWTKHVWSTIDSKDAVNKHIFEPYNDYFVGINPETESFSFHVLQKQKANMKENLWNILLYHFYSNELKMYIPYNPDWAITKDHGHLLFEMNSSTYGSKPNGSIDNDTLFRDNLIGFELVGFEYFDPYPIAMTDEYGDDSIDIDGNTVYYPNDIIWYQDKDIVQFKIKETWEINEQGAILKKTIDAIAPMKNELDENGNIVGVHELFWVDFTELKTILDNYFIYDDKDSTKKIHSFSEYFDQRKFSSTIIEQDSLHVK